jgi:hypothetical protein
MGIFFFIDFTGSEDQGSCRRSAPDNTVLEHYLEVAPKVTGRV